MQFGTLVLNQQVSWNRFAHGRLSRNHDPKMSQNLYICQKAEKKKSSWLQNCRPARVPPKAMPLSPRKITAGEHEKKQSAGVCTFPSFMVLHNPQRSADSAGFVQIISCRLNLPDRKAAPELKTIACSSPAIRLIPAGLSLSSAADTNKNTK